MEYCPKRITLKVLSPHWLRIESRHLSLKLNHILKLRLRTSADYQNMISSTKSKVKNLLLMWLTNQLKWTTLLARQLRDSPLGNWLCLNEQIWLENPTLKVLRWNIMRRNLLWKLEKAARTTGAQLPIGMNITDQLHLWSLFFAGHLQQELVVYLIIFVLRKYPLQLHRLQLF